MLYRTLTCLALAFALNLSTAAAQEKEIEKASPDDQFLIKAGMKNTAIVRMTELVATRAESEKIKDFAKVVLGDHKAAGEKLGEIVKNRKLGVAAGLDKETRDEIDRLSKLKGVEFDKAFLDSFIREHENCVKMCKDFTTTSKDEVCMKFAKECLATIEDHLKRARELRQGLR